MRINYCILCQILLTWFLLLVIWWLLVNCFQKWYWFCNSYLVLGSSSKFTCCWKNSFPCDCETEVSFFCQSWNTFSFQMSATLRFLTHGLHIYNIDVCYLLGHSMLNVSASSVANQKKTLRFKKAHWIALGSLQIIFLLPYNLT